METVNTMETLERELAELHIRFGRETLARQCAQAEQVGLLDRIAAQEDLIAEVQAKREDAEASLKLVQEMYADCVYASTYDRLQKENEARRENFTIAVDRMNAALDEVRDRIVDAHAKSGQAWLDVTQAEVINVVRELRRVVDDIVEDLEID